MSMLKSDQLLELLWIAPSAGVQQHLASREEIIDSATAWRFWLLEKFRLSAFCGFPCIVAVYALEVL
jgi:hypothetical protein